MFTLAGNNITQAQTNSKDWRIVTVDNPSPGYLYFNWDHFFLLDNYGNEVISRPQGIGDFSYCRLLDNGFWIEHTESKFYLFDESFSLKDSIPFPKDYAIDFHDFGLLSNGHYLLFCTKNTVTDMSQYVKDGKKDAVLSTHVLVETDKSGVIYWKWDAADYLNILDACEDVDLTQQSILLHHINSFCEDKDGSILISVRDYDAIIKVDKSSGKILWRLGGSKSKINEFQILNDNQDGFVGFSHQHSISLDSNGRLLMFDNGNLKDNQYSRAVEYQLDQQAKTATKTWDYKQENNAYQNFMGSAIRQPNGNILINWGVFRITEVRPDKSIAFDLQFNQLKVPIYKAFRYRTKMDAVEKMMDAKAEYIFKDAKFNTGLSLKVESISGSALTGVEKHYYKPIDARYADTNFSMIYPNRWTISQYGIKNFNAILKIDSSAVEGLSKPEKAAIYMRNTETYGTFRELTTSYNSQTKQLSAEIDNSGEICIGTKSIGKLAITEPISHYGINTECKIAWTKDYAAESFRLQFAEDDKFTSILIDTLTQANEIRISKLSNSTLYYCRVMGFGKMDTTTWSETFSFETKLRTPVLLYPADDARNLKISDSLTWKSVAKADYYNLQVSSDQSFDVILIDTMISVATRYANLGRLKDNNRYYWRVGAFRPKDSSDYSTGRTFVMGNESSVVEGIKNVFKCRKSALTGEYLLVGDNLVCKDYSIYDMLGHLLKTGSVNDIGVDFRGFESGCYLLCIDREMILVLKP